MFAPELLEDRRLFSADSLISSTFAAHRAADTVYIESNNPAAGANAVLGFHRDSVTGALSPLPGGPFLTNGAGFYNSQELLGPDDSDKEVIASPDGKFLFAVNQGSNSVAVFRILDDGSLDLVDGHAFPSGGTQPDSLALNGNVLYVTNRGDAEMGVAGTIAPNYTAFTVNHDGSLSAIPGSTVTLPVGLSPAQALVSDDGQFLFGDNFTPPPLLSVAGSNTIEPFQIGSSGTLTPAKGGGVGAAVSPPLILGLAQNPNANIIYAGLPGTGQLAVFTFNDKGALKFIRAIDTQGGGTCWVAINSDGTRLYTSDSGTDSVGVFSLDDPKNPVLIQEFSLGGPKSPTAGGANETVNFQLALDPSGTHLYLLNHQTAADGSFTAGNQIHSLLINPDGTLSEPGGSPLLIPSSLVPAGSHPQGLAVITTTDDSRLYYNLFSNQSIQDNNDDLRHAAGDLLDLLR